MRYLSGPTICRLMRRHRVTTRLLAQRLDISMKRVCCCRQEDLFYNPVWSISHTQKGHPMWFLLLVLVLLPSLTLAEPIDSRQCGFLKTSMTMGAVRERFGAPDEVIPEKPVLVGRRTGPGTAVARTIERTT